MKLELLKAPVPRYMQDSGSLTKRLQQVCDDFSIEEQKQIQVAHGYFCRESLLKNGSDALVLAHSYLKSKDPKTIAVFRTLAGKSLGEQLLFGKAKVKRSDFRFYLASELNEPFGGVVKGNGLLARESYFLWPEQSLRLVEVFFSAAHLLLSP